MSMPGVYPVAPFPMMAPLNTPFSFTNASKLPLCHVAHPPPGLS